jgi:ADP-ribose pyrophosphatase
VPSKPLETEILLHGMRFDVVRVQQATPSGGMHPRDVIRHPGSVVLLPIVDEDKVCLIRNFRIAVGKTLIELPAGTLEPGEDPMTTAARELIEETGYRAKHLLHLHSFYAAPGILDERMRLVLATGLTAGEPEREIGEEIENLLVPWEDAMDMVLDGQIEDAKTIVGLLYYDRWRREVK